MLKAMTMTAVSHAHVSHGQVAEMTKRCVRSQTDVIFVVLDALVRIYEDELIATSDMTAKTNTMFAIS